MIVNKKEEEEVPLTLGLSDSSNKVQWLKTRWYIIVSFNLSPDGHESLVPRHEELRDAMVKRDCLNDEVQGGDGTFP